MNLPSIEQNRKILEAFTAVTGEVRETRCLLDHDGQRMEIVTCADSPRAGVQTSATIGLSVIPIGYLSDSVYLGAEIIGMSGPGFEKFTDVLSACVADILQNRFRVFPGAVYKDAFKDTYPQATVKHLIFDTPQGWEKDLLTLDLGSRQVAWIMAIPVTEAELKLYSENETGELQERFEARKVDLADLNRPSVA